MMKDFFGVWGVKDVFCFLNFGDSIIMDYILLVGNINKDSFVVRYLMECGVDWKDFNLYGSRCGNDEVMVRGIFVNIWIVNKFLKGEVGLKILYVLM